MRNHSYNQSYAQGLLTGYLFASLGYFLFPVASVLIFTGTVASLILSAPNFKVGSKKSSTLEAVPVKPMQPIKNSVRQPAPYRYRQRLPEPSPILSTLKSALNVFKSAGSLIGSTFKACFAMTKGVIGLVGSAFGFGFNLAKNLTTPVIIQVHTKPQQPLKAVKQEKPEWLKAQESEYHDYEQTKAYDWNEQPGRPAPFNPAWTRAQQEGYSEPSAPPAYESESETSDYGAPPSYEEAMGEFVEGFSTVKPVPMI